MFQTSAVNLNVGVSTAVLLNVVDCSQYSRTFYLENLDTTNTMTILFELSTDGGVTWTRDGDPVAVAPGAVAHKVITSLSLLRLRGSGEGKLSVLLVRHVANNSLTFSV